jgi:hypothetical protein
MAVPMPHQTIPPMVLALSQRGTELAPERQKQIVLQRLMALVLQRLTALELQRVHQRREQELEHQKRCPYRMLMLAREHQSLQILSTREGMLQIQLAHWWNRKVHPSVPVQGLQRVHHSEPEPVLQMVFDWKELQILQWVLEQEFQRHRILPRMVPSEGVQLVAPQSHQMWVVVAVVVVAVHQSLQKQAALSFQRVRQVRVIQTVSRTLMPQTASCSIVQTSDPPVLLTPSTSCLPAFASPSLVRKRLYTVCADWLIDIESRKRDL